MITDWMRERFLKKGPARDIERIERLSPVHEVERIRKGTKVLSETAQMLANELQRVDPLNPVLLHASRKLREFEEKYYPEQTEKLKEDLP